MLGLIITVEMEGQDERIALWETVSRIVCSGKIFAYLKIHIHAQLVWLVCYSEYVHYLHI